MYGLVLSTIVNVLRGVMGMFSANFRDNGDRDAILSAESTATRTILQILSHYQLQLVYQMKIF